jgi:hypothetical protein
MDPISEDEVRPKRKLYTRKCKHLAHDLPGEESVEGRLFTTFRF